MEADQIREIILIIKTREGFRSLRELAEAMDYSVHSLHQFMAGRVKNPRNIENAIRLHFRHYIDNYAATPNDIAILLAEEKILKRSLDEINTRLNELERLIRHLEG